MRRALGLGGFLRLLPQDGAFLVVSGQPIGLSQLELHSPRWGGAVPDGFSRGIRPPAPVADLVEPIWDWDIPAASPPTAFPFKVPPAPPPNPVVQSPTLPR